MTERDPLGEVRGQLLRAAATDVEARASRRYRARLRRWLLGLLAALGLSGGIAFAGGLISIGEPRRDPSAKGDRFSPTGDRPIVLTADDEDRRLPWGVAVYSTRGQECAIVGQILGDALGELVRGEFRPYATDFGGVCGRLDQAPFFSDVRSIDGRRLTYGRARDDVAALRLVAGGEEFTAETGPNGAFLFVLDSRAAPPSDLAALDERGRAIGR